MEFHGGGGEGGLAHICKPGPEIIKHFHSQLKCMKIILLINIEIHNVQDK